jgi:hypothetical protein
VAGHATGARLERIILPSLSLCRCASAAHVVPSPICYQSGGVWAREWGSACTVSNNEIVEIEQNQDNDDSNDQRSPAGAILMSSEIIDLTLPAHDPSFPKPRGLLPVPQVIEETVAREEARIARENGIVIAPEARRRMLDDLTIQYYYEGAYVASRRTPHGIEILAVGWDEANQYRENHPPETRQEVRIGIV